MSGVHVAKGRANHLTFADLQIQYNAVSWSTPWISTWGLDRDVHQQFGGIQHCCPSLECCMVYLAPFSVENEPTRAPSGSITLNSAAIGSIRYPFFTIIRTPTTTDVRIP